MPANLPRQSRHHELSEAERVCQGCGQLRIDIGADKSGQLDYRPATLFVIEHIVHKYVCPCCGKRLLRCCGFIVSRNDESPGAKRRFSNDSRVL